MALLAAIVIMFIVQIAVAVHHYTETTSATLVDALYSTLTLDQSENWRKLGAITHDTLDRGMYWRLLTAPFLHGGFFHIVLNAWALLQFGIVFEMTFGSVPLLVVWFFSSIAASATSAVFLSDRISVGASGAIFGIAGALLVMLQSARWQRRLRWRLAVWAALTIILGFASPEIDNAAHIGGVISGLVLGGLLRAVPMATARTRAPDDSTRR